MTLCFYLTGMSQVWQWQDCRLEPRQGSNRYNGVRSILGARLVPQDRLAEIRLWAEMAEFGHIGGLTPIRRK